MSAPPIASTSPERAAHAPKTAQSKQSSVAQGSAPVDFAALLLLADGAEAADESSLTTGNAIDQADAQRQDRSADAPLPSGEMVLAGLLNWRSYAETSGREPAAAATTTTTATTVTASTYAPSLVSTGIASDTPLNPSAWLSQPSQTLSGTRPAMSTEPNTPLRMGEKEWSSSAILTNVQTTDGVTVTTPLRAGEGEWSPPTTLVRAPTSTTEVPPPRTPSGTTSYPGVADVANAPATAREVLTESLAATDLVTQRNSSSASAVSTGNSPASGFAGKPKAGTLRHALSTAVGTSAGASTGALQSAPPSTVALGTREVMPTPTNATSFSTTDRGYGGEKETDVATPETGGLVADGGNPSLKLDRAATTEATPPSVSGSADMGVEPFTIPSPDAPTPTTPEGMEQAMEELGAQIAYWSTQGNQRASLTIGEGSNAPLDVKIAFENGEVHVQFETDESEVRDALNLSAEDTLNRMLEARGMSLGDVSVGSGQAKESPSSAFSDSGRQEKGSTSSSAHPGSASTGTSPTTAGTSRRPAAIISANKLDFFA